jgi:hypothetical protein
VFRRAATDGELSTYSSKEFVNVKAVVVAGGDASKAPRGAQREPEL